MKIGDAERTMVDGLVRSPSVVWNLRLSGDSAKCQAHNFPVGPSGLCVVSLSFATAMENSCSGGRHAANQITHILDCLLPVISTHTESCTRTANELVIVYAMTNCMGICAYYATTLNIVKSRPEHHHVIALISTQPLPPDESRYMVFLTATLSPLACPLTLSCPSTYGCLMVRHQMSR